MEIQKLPKSVLKLFENDHILADKSSWENFLKEHGVVDERHIKIATEGALVACIIEMGVYEELVIVSDDAGQFNIAGFLHALCSGPCRTDY